MHLYKLMGTLMLMADVSRDMMGLPLQSDFRDKVGEQVYDAMLGDELMGEKEEEALGKMCFVTDKGRNMARMAATLFVGTHRDSMKAVLDYAIMAEPSGEVRNALCEANILVLHALEKEKTATVEGLQL